MILRTSFLLLALVWAPGRVDADTPYPVRISENHRSLLDQSGKPFFYLADTAWELFHRLDREQTEIYLQDRASNRFNVIQAVVLAEHGGLVEPNPQGHLPLRQNDPSRPVEAYFADVDWIVNRADQLGMCVGMLPTWGDKWNKKWGQGPEIFTPENARSMASSWANGTRTGRSSGFSGAIAPSRPSGSGRSSALWPRGLRAGDGGRHLITFHPAGGQSSADCAARRRLAGLQHVPDGARVQP